jgi:CRP-like cAMP-binding protein
MMDITSRGFYPWALVAERPVVLPPAKGRECAMPHRSNLLLARVSPADMNTLRQELVVAPLAQGHVLAESHEEIKNVYFPHSGILSFVVELLDGEAIETGMVGRDGEFGAAQALDDKVSLNKVVIQVPGTASVLGAHRLKSLANSMPDFRALLIKYELFFASQAQQTSACNAVHDVQTRMCKWLLRMHELVGNDLPLTQDFLAQMMGVRRTSVTGVAIELQKAGMISYSRGHIHIEDIRRVRENACECHEALESHYEKILGNRSTAHGMVLPRSPESIVAR